MPLMSSGCRRLGGGAGHDLEPDQVIATNGGDELLRFVVDDSGVLERTDWTLAAYTVGGERTLADRTQAAVWAVRKELV